MTTLTEEIGSPNHSGDTQLQQPKYRNVGRTEREVSALAGGALAIAGLSRGSVKGLAAAGLGAALLWRGFTGHCAGYAKLGIDTNNDEAEPEDYFDHGIHVEHAFTVNKPRAELFQFWRKLENLPRFMSHLKSVETLDEKRSRWNASGPAGTTITWDAEIINEEPDALLAWKSLGGADVDNSGSVRFVDAPGDRGTEVRVVIDYIPPAGRAAKYLAMLFGKAPEQTVREDLRKFKQLMEAGEVPTIEGQPTGTCGR